MVDISPRVQRLIVRSFPYQPFTVIYKKGKDIPVADALSHVTPMDPEDNIKLPNLAINMITKLVLTSTFTQDNFSRKLDQIRKSTSQDNQLTRLSRYINTGFPCEKKNLPRDLQDYWNCRDMLSIENALVTCGSRIIVPHEMRAEMLQYIHEGHQGKERCLLRARNTVFWPRISYDMGRQCYLTVESFCTHTGLRSMASLCFQLEVNGQSWKQRETVDLRPV